MGHYDGLRDIEDIRDADEKKLDERIGQRTREIEDKMCEVFECSHNELRLVRKILKGTWNNSKYND